jgi:hypothetical protein
VEECVQLFDPIEKYHAQRDTVLESDLCTIARSLDFQSIDCRASDESWKEESYITPDSDTDKDMEIVLAHFQLALTKAFIHPQND